MSRKSLFFVLLSMVAGVLLFTSWVRTQEQYRDAKGRPALRYSQQDSLWKKADYGVFLSLNGTMRNRPAMQMIWGVTNHRAFDLFAAVWMILLFLIYYVRNPRHEDRAALIQFGLYMTIALLLVAAISEMTIHFQRLSPGNTDGLRSQAVLLTDLDRITWTVKIGSSNSFPGDHATVLLLIGSFIIWRLRSWYGWAAAVGVVAFSLPRLAGGGHWLSDILAGSLSFYLLIFPLFLLPPLREAMLAALKKPAGWIYKPLSVFEKR